MPHPIARQKIINILLVLAMLIFPISVFAATEHECVFDKFDIKIITDEENDIHLTVFKDGVKVTACRMKVTSYDDGKKGRSTSESIRFETIGCDAVDAALASGIAIIGNGSIATSRDHRSSYAYVIKNVQPLECRSK